MDANDFVTLTEITRPGLADAMLRLAMAGWIKAGEGYFGVAFVHPRQRYALKLFSRYDRAFLWYLNYVKAHQGERFMPQIYGNPVKVTDDYYAVRMQKYGRASDLIDETDIKWFAKAVENGMTTDHIKALPWYEVASDYMRNLLRLGFYDRLKDIGDRARDRGFSLDLHIGNVMSGPGNELVITDPLIGPGRDNTKLTQVNRLMLKPGRRGPEAPWPKEASAELATEAVRPKHVHALASNMSPPIQDKVRMIADLIEHGYDAYLNRVHRPTEDMRVVHGGGQLKVWLRTEWLRFPGPEPERIPYCMVRIGLDEAVARFEARFIEQVRGEIVRAYARVGWEVQIDDQATIFVYPDDEGLPQPLHGSV